MCAVLPEGEFSARMVYVQDKGELEYIINKRVLLSLF